MNDEAKLVNWLRATSPLVHGNPLARFFRGLVLQLLAPARTVRSSRTPAPSVVRREAAVVHHATTSPPLSAQQAIEYLASLPERKRARLGDTRRDKAAFQQELERIVFIRSELDKEIMWRHFLYNF